MNNFLSLNGLMSLLDVPGLFRNIQDQKAIVRAQEELKKTQQRQELAAQAASLPFKKFEAYQRALA